jgi:hypothetical protein
MEIQTESSENRKEINAYLRNAILNIRKNMTGFEVLRNVRRQGELELRRKKYNSDLDRIEESLQKFNAIH